MLILIMLKKELLDILVCTKCKGELICKDSLECRKCGLMYKILKGGIPDMLLEHAENI